MSEHVTFPKPPPRVAVKAQARKVKERERREAYKFVDWRDGRRCRACGCACRPTMECVPNRLEHHHLRFRSLGGKGASGNLVTLCLSCHVEAQQHRLVIRGNADSVLTFEQDGKVWRA